MSAASSSSQADAFATPSMLACNDAPPTNWRMILPPSTTFFGAPLWGAEFTMVYQSTLQAFHVTASESAAVRITFFLVWQRHSAVLPVLCTSSLKSLKLFVSLQRRGRKLQRVATMPTLQNLSPRRNTLDPPLGSGWWWSHPSQKTAWKSVKKATETTKH